MLLKLKLISMSRKSWLLLALICLGIELSAVYFQYGLNLSPCELCIYERVAILVILLAGIFGAIAPKVWLLRMFAFTLWLAGSIKGLMLGIEHESYQQNPFLMQCGLKVKFPDFIPLDKLLPEFFQSYGSCSEVAWDFAGLTMVQWIVVIFAVNLTLAVLFLISQIVKIKSSSFY